MEVDTLKKEGEAILLVLNGNRYVRFSTRVPK